MHARDYAEAMFLATQGKDDVEQDVLVGRLREMLASRGHMALLPAIIRELEKVSCRTASSDGAQVRVVRATDATVHAERIACDVATLGMSDVVQEVVIDETVIGGYEVRASGRRIDRTHKRTLLELYTTITNQ